MGISSEYREAVESKNIRRVRIMLKNIMLLDTTMKNFDEMSRYAEKKLPNLYDEHNGEKFVDSISGWNKEYMDIQMVIVVSNFSRERIEILKKIIKHIYPIRDDGKGTTADSNKKDTMNGKQVAGGLMVAAGTIGFIVGLVESVVPMIVIGGISAIGGVVIISGDKKK